MIISDISYLEESVETNSILGGVYAEADAKTFARNGFGSADAYAIAIGKSSSTTTKTSVNVYSGTTSITDSYSQASAYAKTDNITYRVEEDSLSLSIST